MNAGKDQLFFFWMKTCFLNLLEPFCFPTHSKPRYVFLNTLDSLVFSANGRCKQRKSTQPRKKNITWYENKTFGASNRSKTPSGDQGSGERTCRLAIPADICCVSRSKAEAGRSLQFPSCTYRQICSGSTCSHAETHRGSWAVGTWSQNSYKVILEWSQNASLHMWSTVTHRFNVR